MEKQFNIVLDTKKTGFNTLRGIKQGDNNSVLNITLVQNSVPFNLSGLTIRINYKRPDGQVLLQMADVVSDKESKIKVNILTKALDVPGEVQADLSVFDKDNKKITSATFPIVVENSVYTSDYIENDDLDIIQKVYTSEIERVGGETTRVSNEKDRVANEKNRKTNETERVEAETNRISNEDIRKSNETNRDNAEKLRLANESERIVNETTRQTNFETIKADYNTYKNVMTCESNVAALQEQINENKEQLADNATKEVTQTTNNLPMPNAVDGLCNIEIGGNTLKNLFDYSKVCLSNTVLVNDSYFKLINLSTSHDSLVEKGKIPLKPDTNYTLVLDIKTNTLNKILSIRNAKTCFQNDVNIPIGTTGIQKYILKTKSDFTDAIYSLWFYHPKENTTGDFEFRIMLLEGDYTNKAIPSYFESIKSVGELEENIETVSCGKNLIKNDSDIKTMPNNEGWGVAQKMTDEETPYWRVTADVKVSTYERNVYSYMQKNCKVGEKYAISCDVRVPNEGDVGFYSSRGMNSNVPSNTWTRISYTFTYSNNFRVVGHTYNGKQLDYRNWQLEEGNQATTYEPYVQDKIDILKGKPLPKFDKICGDIYTKGTGKTVLDGRESWDWNGTMTENTTIFYLGGKFKSPISDKFNSLNREPTSKEDYEYISTNRSFTILHVSISKSKLSSYGFKEGDQSTYISSWKAWLQANPTTVYYELAEPVIEKLPQPLTLKSFKNGSVRVNTVIPPTISVKYPTNLNSRLSSVEEVNNAMLDSLGGAWRTLLILADRELAVQELYAECEWLEKDPNVDVKYVAFYLAILMKILGGNY